MIHIEHHEGVTLLLLNRPERRNALCTELMETLAAQLTALAARAQTRAVILTGAGGVFCAGSDLKELAALDVVGMGRHEEHTAAVVRALVRFPKPVLAAVEGYALGGGCALALACDLVVAGRSARIAMPEVANGWIPPWGLARVHERCGPFAARRLVWGAEALDPEALRRLGAVDHVTDDGASLAEARRLAERLAHLPAHAVAATKLFFSTPAPDPEAADAACAREFVAHCDTPAARGTFAKFFNKG